MSDNSKERTPLAAGMARCRQAAGGVQRCVLRAFRQAASDARSRNEAGEKDCSAGCARMRDTICSRTEVAPRVVRAAAALYLCC